MVGAEMEIVWSDAAVVSAQVAADYALQEFGASQVRRLREKIKYALRRISTMPTSCPLEQSLLGLTPTYRYVTLFPHLEIIFHQEDENICMIDLIWNTRKNLSLLKHSIDV